MARCYRPAFTVPPRNSWDFTVIVRNPFGLLPWLVVSGLLKARFDAMEKIKRVFRRPKDESHWPNPRDSIGDRIGTSPDGKSTYWMAKGPARDVWKDLGRNIASCIEIAACNHGSAYLIVELYMFGSNEDTAAPQVMICSEDKKARDEVVKAIEKGGVMKEHPAIGLEQMSKLPNLTTKQLSQDDIEFNTNFNSNIGMEKIVLTPPSDKPFGRRLYIPSQDGSALRRATAGPILHINSKVYQLTVGHTFLESGDFPLSQDSLQASEHRNQNKTEEGNSLAAQELAMTGTTRPHSLDSGVDLTREATNDRNVVPRKLDSLGKLAWLSDISNSNSLDYAFIAVEEAYSQDSNQVPCGPNGSQRPRQVRQTDDPKDVNVITMTASFGFMTGKLCATASYVRFPNQRTLQELYPLHLDGKLADGDCGSGVVDQVTGHLYGHIVAGTAGTGNAYIVSAEDVFRDIRKNMGVDVTLFPEEQIPPLLPEEQRKGSKLSKNFKIGGYSERVHDNLLQSGVDFLAVEFASKEYFRDLNQPSQPKDKEVKLTTIAPIQPKSSPVQPTTFEKAGPSCARSVKRTHPLSQTPIYTKLKDIPRTITQPLPPISNLKSTSAFVNRKTNSTRKLTNNLSHQLSKTFAFEELFFGLPSDLQVNVVAYLCVPDILNLRQVSKTWLEFITSNEAPISRLFLKHNPVPRFAVNLYPLPAPSELDLNYIRRLWHQLAVTSKLSTLLADWIATDIFLQETDRQKQGFLPQRARIIRRLIPILFTIGHFFQTYRYLLVQQILDKEHPLRHEDYIINPIERYIMNLYDNKTLLQVHQVFPVILSCLSRRLRPPSYFGRLERSLHGYVRPPLPAPVLVGLLYIGGMEEVIRISEIETYNSRRAAVDDWYLAVFRQPIDYTHEARHCSLSLFQKKFRQLPSNAVANSSLNQTCNGTPSTGTAPKPSIAFTSSTGDPGNSVPISGSDQPLPVITLTLGDIKDPKGKGKQKATANLPYIPIRQPLSAEQARSLLQSLPALKDIWVPTAEKLLLARQAVDRWQDIKRVAQAMHELILAHFTAADELFYGCTAEDFDPDIVKHGWGDLLDDGRDMESSSEHVVIMSP